RSAPSTSPPVPSAPRSRWGRIRAPSPAAPNRPKSTWPTPTATPCRSSTRPASAGPGPSPLPPIPGRRWAAVPTPWPSLPPGRHGLIRHIIYVIKENRTFDQVMGSLGRGDGDPALDLFGEESAPNQRALARQFVTLDNFYADADVSADGWSWSTAAEANTYVQ